MTTYAGRAVFPAFFVDTTGDPLESTSVTVYNRGTLVKPTLYTDRTKATQAANPFITDSLGNAFPYLDPGEYDALVNGTTIPFTVVADPVEPTILADGSVTDAKVATGAAIAQSKVAGLVTDLATKQPAGWGAERVSALVHKLRSGVESCGIQLIGDSTGLADPGWFIGLTNWLAAQFPAYSFARRSWNSLTDRYSLPATVLGTAGRRRLIMSDTGTDYYMTVPDSAATSITGDIDVRVRVAVPTITPAVNYALAAKFTTTGNQRSWFLELQPSGKLAFYWSVDGATSVNRISTVALPAGVANGLYWLRATLDVDNGAAGHDVKFYYGTNGATWTQLGATVTTAGTTSIFDSTSTTQLNGRGATANATGAMGMAGMEYHHLLVIPGLADGPPVIDLMPGVWHGLGGGQLLSDFAGNAVTVLGTTGSIAGAPICAVMNASASGQPVAYSNDAARFAKQTPYACDVTYISYSHNDASTLAYRAPYKQLIDAVVAKWPDTGIVAVAQNPKRAPAINVANHAVRNGIIAALAVSQRHGLVDVFRAFQSVGDFSTYVEADGIHPTTLGYELWRDEAKKAYRAADRLLAAAT